MLYIFIGFIILCIVTIIVCLILMYKGKYNPKDDLDDVDIDIILNDNLYSNSEDNYDISNDDL